MWLVVAFFSANVVFGAFYLDRIYPGVEVAGVQLSHLTQPEASSRLAATVSDYNLRINVAGRTEKAKPEQLGLKFDVEATVDMAMQRGRYFALIPLWGLRDSMGPTGLRYAYNVDQGKLKAYVSKIAGENSAAPVDATIKVVDGKPQVVADVVGVGIDQDRLAELVDMAVAEQLPEIKVEATEIAAAIRAKDITGNLQEAEKLLSASIILTYQGKQFSPSRSTVGDWLVFAKDGAQLKTGIDEAKVKSYVASIAKSIDQASKQRLINVLNGKVQGEEPGKDGLAVVQPDVVAKLVEGIRSGGLKLELPTRPVAFKTVYNRSVNLDFGRYIEINLSLQRLWAYEDHKTVYESAITSGATGAGYPTVTGLFDIYSKARNRNLNGYAIGYNYNVFVQYWMPFSGNYGMHDASWRSNFGGPDYYYNGSHGCVNMPLESAAWIYNWADVGTPVWVHN
jgi:vancomycin resistance protein YoaR